MFGFFSKKLEDINTSSSDSDFYNLTSKNHRDIQNANNLESQNLLANNQPDSSIVNKTVKQLTFNKSRKKLSPLQSLLVVILGVLGALLKYYGTQQRYINNYNNNKLYEYSQTHADKYLLSSIYNSPNIHYLVNSKGYLTGLSDWSKSPFTYYTYLPTDYASVNKYGLLIYLPTDNNLTQMLPGWKEVCNKLNLIYVCPQGVSAVCGDPNVTCNSVIYGTLEMMRKYNIDRNRIYLVGFSGCARTACDLGFYQYDLFNKIIAVCGSEYYHKVPKICTVNENDTLGHFYGLNTATPFEVKEAKKNDQFVFITGSKDFRKGNIIDIYNEGYKKDGFKADLIVLDGMYNQPIPGNILELLLKKFSK